MAYINGKEILFSPTIDGIGFGKQAAYNAFWDIYQDNGNRESYENAFAGQGWTSETFKPKYDMTPTSAYMMFRNFNAPKLDLVERLTEMGVSLDFSNCTNMQYAFYGVQAKRIGEVYLHNDLTNVRYIFMNAQIETIDKVIFPEGNTHEMNFSSNAIKNIDFEGTITRTFTISGCNKLTAQSAKNAINHLANYAGTESEGLYSFKLHANTWAALEADSSAPDGKTWQDYVTTTLGWLI